jgi:Domain of unknown function (DUF4920)
MRVLMCAAILTAATTMMAAQETKLGAGVTLKEATPLSALIEKPAEFVGKTVRVDGIATAVCEEMGCWLALSADGAKDSKTVRLKVEDGEIVFPISAKGKNVSAEGVFEEIGGADAHAKQAAGEHAKHDAAASRTYQIKATGAVIK